MKGLRPLHASPKYNADFIDNLSPEILQMQGFRAVFVCAAGEKMPESMGMISLRFIRHEIDADSDR